MPLPLLQLRILLLLLLVIGPKILLRQIPLFLMLNKLLSMLLLKLSMISKKANNTVKLTKIVMKKENAGLKRIAGLRSRKMTGRRRLPTFSWIG